MRRSVRIVLPTILLVAVLAGHTALWFFATGYLRTAYETWAAQRRAAGWQVGSAPLVRGGWPLAATLTIPDLTLAGGPANAPGRVTWHAAQTTLSLTAQHPTLLDADIAGTQTLQVAPMPARTFEAERLHIEVPLGHHTGPDATLEVRNLKGDGGSVGLLTAQVVGGATPTLSASAEAIDLAGGTDMWPLGPRISSVAVDATLHGALPTAGPPAASAAAWRDSGGSLDITHLALGWGPLGLSAKTQITLDDRLQPAGTADLRIVGYAKTLQALAAHRVITPDAALAATAVLTLLARTGDDGGAPEVDVPLTLKGSKLSFGHTPLVKVPDLVWPQ